MATRVTRARAQTIVEVVVVIAMTAFVVWRLHPSLVFADTLPAGGDLSSHNWGPDFLQRRTLPALSGWSWDWFAGFPAYVFYPVLTALGVVLLDVVVPYGVAMKLTIASGLVALPAASWAFARLWRLPFPVAPLMAVAAVAFLFDGAHDFGGNIRSTTGGEHSHALGMTLAVLTLGLVALVVRDGRWRTLTALTLAAALLAHPLSGLFVVMGVAAIVVVHLDGDRATLLRRVLPPCAVGGAIAGLWWIPFLAWHGEMTSPDFVRGTGFGNLASFGWGELLVLALAVSGAILGWRAGYRVVGALAIVAGVHVALYLVLPRGQLENLRVIPPFLWCRLALAAVGVALLARLAAAHFRARWVTVAAPVAVAVAALVAVGVAWHVPPFGSDGAYALDRYVQVAFAGYERNPQFAEYDALMRTMARVGRTHGCGRFAWSMDVRTTDFGTVSNDLAPYRTDGCIASLSGLYYDSSATTPMISLTEALIGIAAPGFAPDVPYRPFDLEEGVRHLRYLGVRYYAARTGPVIDAAEADPGLARVATSGPWRVYEVADADLVQPLPYEPIVAGIDGVSWARAATSFTERAPDWDERVLTEHGPASWDRLTSSVLPDPRPQRPVRVARIEQGDGSLSFRVDRTGVPVLVKASYFPTWSVVGGDGPYRAAGNMMVVIPTETSVRLEQRRTVVGWLALLSFGSGLVGAVALAVVDRRASRAARSSEPPA